MKLVGVTSAVVLLFALVAADDAHSLDGVPLTALMETGASLPNEFTVCLKSHPMMCLAPGADLKQDGTALVLADRLRTPGQRFRLEQGVLHMSASPNRVISAEHGAQNQLDTTAGGRVWVWERQELNFDQQWMTSADSGDASQLCMRAFPKACVHTSYPAENKVNIASSESARTMWVLRPIQPCGSANPCDSNAICNAQDDGSAKCVCHAGYSLGVDNKCYEVDLCATPATNPCDEHASCTHTGPAKADCKPHNGYQGKGLKGQVTPIDACKANPNPCGLGGDCYSTGPNVFKCGCKVGYIATGPTTCAELDLCATANPCANTATCTKTGPGQASCQCNAGFAGNGQSCTPVNGCDGTPCGEHATCTPQPLGARQCVCDKGYGVDPKAKSFRCIEQDACASKPCKGRNSYCKRTGPGEHKCLCKHGFLAFWNGNCEVPGSKEALAAAASEGSESARQELIMQQRKVKEAEEQRKEIERAFRRKQKEREENIRALERRIRELIRERTNVRISDRDSRVKALSERVSSLINGQTEAQKAAAEQLRIIKSLEKHESEKVKRLTEAMAAASAKIAAAAKAYAVKLRDTTRADNAFDAAPVPAPAAAPKPAAAEAVAAAPAKAPAQPPRYGDQYSSAPLKLPINKGIASATHTIAAAAAAATPAAAPKPIASKPVKRRTRRHRRRLHKPRRHRRRTAPPTVIAAPPKPSTPIPSILSRFAQVHTEAGAEAEAEAAAEMEMEEGSHVSVEAEVAHSLDADLAALANQEVTQSDEDLEEQLAALHAEVDSHLDQVLATENEEEESEDQ